MASVRFGMNQRKRAKKEGKPLVCLHVDKKHIGGGSASYHYVATPEQAEEVWALLEKHLGANCREKEAPHA